MNEIIDNLVYFISHPFIMLLMGLLTHFGRKMLAAAAHGTATPPCFSDYWRKQPIQSALAVIGALVGYSLFAYFPDFDKMAPDIQGIVRSTAFGVGYMADNIADAVGEKAFNKIKGQG